ncbi:MAG TPA: phage tail protein [Motilibacterales bacterium]|nr:phage tail protein [Motilibacterales bacterium]
MAGPGAPGRTFSWLVNADQWARCAHEGTALLPDGTVELTWTDPVDAAGSCRPAPSPACEPVDDAGSLALDSFCRAYRSRPALGRVDVLPPSAGGARAVSPCADAGPKARGVLDHPTGLAVDRRLRLSIVEAGADAVRVVDMRSGRLLRRVVVAQGHPVDVAADCGQALVLVRSRQRGRLLILDGRRGTRPGPELARPCFPAGLAPHRIASASTGSSEDGPAPGRVVLWRAADGRCAIAAPDGDTLAVVDGATDLDLGDDGRLVVSFGAGTPIRDFQVEDGALIEREPLLAPGFDGGAVVIAPDGRIAFTTANGYGWTAGTAARRVTEGRVVTYRLDSQAYGTRWGRVFVDACLPHGTSLTMRFVTTDVDAVLDAIPRTPPTRGARTVLAPQETPPQVPAHLLDAAIRGGEAHRPYRRPNGGPEPWPLPGQSDSLATHEMPVDAPPGRYLWIEILLRGTTRVSPTLSSLRVERPGHALLNALPRSWSRREDDAAFLQRLLAPAEGMLHELDQRAAERAALVNPHSTPSEALAWLSSFAGLAVDRRWPDDARRTMLAEVYQLFRHRGTEACLLRLMQVYLGVRPALIETWRLRGLAGTVLGTRPTRAPDEVVGGSASRTSALGRFAVGGQPSRSRRGVSLGVPVSTGYDAAAHRFTVLVPGALTPEQRAVLTDLLDAHRPAHTLFELCELGEGMRIGRTVRLDLTAYVGPSATPDTVVVGRNGLGVDTTIAAPAVGGRLDATNRVGAVRVG